MSRLIIRADASPTMGTGHSMRCLALAQAARDSGWEVIMAGHVDVPWVVERVYRENVPFEFLAGPPPPVEAPGVLAKWAQQHQPDSIALDGYHFGLDCQRRLRGLGYKLLVVDDYNHLPKYCADILLNQNVGSESLQYHGDIGQKLLGPSYALLRPEFRAARVSAESRVFLDRPRNLLLTLGGGNFIDYLHKLAPYFNLPEMERVTLRIISGKMDKELINSAFSDYPGRLEILSAVDNMSSLLLGTDLCVTAGGSTCWELCCLGVPFMTVEVAKNQGSIVKHLEHMNIAPIFSSQRLESAMTSFADIVKTRVPQMELVDGGGALKVLRGLAWS